jgi:hypothetical protein
MQRKEFLRQKGCRACIPAESELLDYLGAPTTIIFAPSRSVICPGKRSGLEGREFSGQLL